MTQLNPEAKHPIRALLHTRGSVCLILEVDPPAAQDDLADGGPDWDWTAATRLKLPSWEGLAIFEGTSQAVLTGAPDCQDWEVKYEGKYRRLNHLEVAAIQAGPIWPRPEPVDPLDDDRDPNNPVEMSADQWSEVYRRMGDDYEEFMDHDQSMNG